MTVVAFLFGLFVVALSMAASIYLAVWRHGLGPPNRALIGDSIMPAA